jgi:hypothetical protein
LRDANQLLATGTDWSDRPSYNSYSGNYAVSALNVWLWAHAHQHVTLINFFNNLAPELDPATMNDVLARAPPGCDRIFVRFNKTDTSISISACGGAYRNHHVVQ